MVSLPNQKNPKSFFLWVKTVIDADYLWISPKIVFSSSSYGRLSLLLQLYIEDFTLPWWVDIFTPDLIILNPTRDTKTNTKPTHSRAEAIFTIYVLLTGSSFEQPVGLEYPGATGLDQIIYELCVRTKTCARFDNFWKSEDFDLFQKWVQRHLCTLSLAQFYFWKYHHQIPIVVCLNPSVKIKISCGTRNSIRSTKRKRFSSLFFQKISKFLKSHFIFDVVQCMDKRCE